MAVLFSSSLALCASTFVTSTLAGLVLAALSGAYLWALLNIGELWITVCKFDLLLPASCLRNSFTAQGDEQLLSKLSLDLMRSESKWIGASITTDWFWSTAKAEKVLFTLEHSQRSKHMFEIVYNKDARSVETSCCGPAIKEVEAAVCKLPPATLVAVTIIAAMESKQALTLRAAAASLSTEKTSKGARDALLELSFAAATNGILVENVSCSWQTETADDTNVHGILKQHPDLIHFQSLPISM